MALILNIETSTEVCSVALALDGRVINHRENLGGQNHASLLTLFIEELINELNPEASQIDAVAVSGGPGSYTGLRIGVSVAKGICYASHLPLITITSLEAMALNVAQNLDSKYKITQDNLLFCPMIDARRMEVYTAFYDINMTLSRHIQADIIDHESYLDLLESNLIFFFGNGAFKCRETISHPNAIFIPDIYTSAINMVPIAEKCYQKNQFSDVAYYEPFYLKDFVATAPTKNIFLNNQNK